MDRRRGIVAQPRPGRKGWRAVLRAFGLVVLAAAADRLRESVGGGLTVESGRWVTEHPRDAARRQLTDTEIDRAWAQGHTMGLEDAVAYVRTA